MSQGITLTPEQLKEMLLTMAAELRRPPDPTPQELAQREQDLRDRRATAEQQLHNMEMRRARQLTCSHLRSNGSTTAVYVQNLNLMICQHCQALIYPVGQNGVEEGIYDTALFNKLLQLYSDSVGNV